MGDNIERHQQCRICHDSTTDASDAANDHANPLIQPCKCRGTMKYVHLNCWDQMQHKCRICNYPLARPPVEDPHLEQFERLVADMEVDEDPRVHIRLDALPEPFIGLRAPQQPRNEDPVDQFLRLFQSVMPVVLQCFHDTRMQIARERIALQRQMMERLYHLTETRTYQLFHGLIVVYFATMLIGMICTQCKAIIA